MLLSAVLSKSVVEHLILNNTLTTWRFLIKVPYLGKLSVMCDAENNLSSDEKQSMVERSSLIWCE